MFDLINHWHDTGDVEVIGQVMAVAKIDHLSRADADAKVSQSNLRRRGYRSTFGEVHDFVIVFTLNNGRKRYGACDKVLAVRDQF